MFRNVISTVLWVVVLSGTAMAQRPSTFTSFDVPGAKSTTAWGINADGAVVGTYVDSNSKQHGFLLSGGKVTTIDYPSAVVTTARGINAHGDIIGTHTGPNAATPGSGGDVHGFLLRAGESTPEPLDYPGHMNTIPQRINEAGQVVGCYHDYDTMGTMHGMMAENGNFVGLDGSQYGVDLPMSMSNGVTPDGNVVVGLYMDMMGVNRSYIASAGTFAGFDFPFSIGTSVWDMNASGEVVGVYTDAAKRGHGFLLSLGDLIATFGAKPQGATGVSFSFASVDFPGASTTNAYGINVHGDIVGSYIDTAGKIHAFLLSRGRRRGQ
jgi:probable HAF family extracellular repeat protein